MTPTPCTADACDKATGKCTAKPAADGSACSDGNGCTSGDACLAGTCTGKAVVCNDNDVCTVDLCAPLTGKCVFNGIPKCGKFCASDLDCGGKDVCFQPLCVSTVCQNKPLTGTPCNDGKPCTTTDACQSGVCLGKAVDCNDGNPCTLDACNPATGKCVAVPSASGTACDDKNLCTAGDVCKTGLCQGSAIGCSDNNPCTLDKCDAATGKCSSTVIPGCGAACTTKADCNDGNVCTSDLCALGKCVFQSSQGTPCDDGNLCTAGDTCKAGGVCGNGQPVVCDDKNGCTQDSCDAKTGKCVFSAAAAGSACEDGNLCTSGEKCTGTTCGGGQLAVCNDGKVCTMDACVPQTGKCAFVDIPGCGSKCKVDSDCPSTGVQCAVPACVAGKCYVSATPGKTCNDGNACTSGDVCSPTCVGAPITCDDKDPCTKDQCDPKAGCSFQKIAGCGVKCKLPTDCDDKDLCTFDTCNAFTGNCLYTKIANCTANPQCKTQTDCDDADACTADYCDLTKSQCAHVKIPGCNPAPQCKLAADCDDKNKCTQDFCNTFTAKCQYVPLPGCTP